MRRGSAYWVNLGAAAPPELGKVRPGIVVSNSMQNERLDSVVIVPLSKSRLQESIGAASAAAMARIGEALALYLGE